jgi:hypothetical protein
MNHFDHLRQQIAEFLQGPIKEWGTYLGLDAPPFHRNYRAFYTAHDVNGVQINMHVDNKFDTSAVQLNQSGRYVLFDSNPASAHKSCNYVLFKSYHFIKAKLYKCGPAALLPEFDIQHNFDISDSDRKILHSYKPLTVENFSEYKNEFLESLNNPIDQCKFCPQHKTHTIISPVRKGSLQL